MGTVVEIRSYRLKPGSRGAFHALVVERSIPMLSRWKVDVVAFGPSLHDDESYVLIRAYESLDRRQASQDAFYGSAEWKEGPRDALMAMIESYTTVVLEMDETAVEALRAGARVGVREE
jgi:NIPSNAP